MDFVKKLLGGLKGNTSQVALAGAAPTAGVGVPQSQRLSAKPAKAAPAVEDDIVRSLDKLPPIQGVLTVGHRAVMRLPDPYCHMLAAVEVGVRRCMILVAPADELGARAPEIKSLLGQLRVKLNGDRFQTEAVNGRYQVLCRRSVIEQIVRNHVERHGAGDLGDINREKSQAQQWYLNALDMAVKEGATDIHFESIGGGRGAIKLRVDGELEPIKDGRGGIYTDVEVQNIMAWPFNSGLKSGSNSSGTWDAGKALSCMTEPRTVGDKQISVRYQSSPGLYGPKAVARLLNVDTSTKTLTYQQLGYEASQRALFRDATNAGTGMVVLAGVTGSGKTTTLKTMVELHPGNGTMAMFSIEDPVEYPMRGVHHIQVQRDINDEKKSAEAFMTSVVALMRMDPDIAVIGEVRDRASAGAAQAMAETGHMAMGTVHAHLISGIVPRLTNEAIGMQRDVLAGPSMLRLLVYQALVPLLCPHCCLGFEDALRMARERDAASLLDAEEAEHLEQIRHQSEVKLKADWGRYRFKRLGGCPKCGGRGTKGLTVVAEMMTPSLTWLDLMRQHRDFEAMVHWRRQWDGDIYSRNMDSKPIFLHTLYKALQGQVDPVQCERFETFKEFVLEYP